MNIANILSIPLEIDFEFLFFILFHIFVYHYHLEVTVGFLGSTTGKEPVCQCRSHRSAGLICRRRVWQPTAVFLPEASPWTEETGGLQSIGLKKVIHGWSDLAQHSIWPFGRKVMMNLDSVLKSRDIILPTKVCIVKAMIFSVVTYGCRIWS